MSETEMSSGTVWIAVSIALESDSGRDKHTDVVEQGAWIYASVESHLNQLSKNLQGAALLEVAYYGDDPNGPKLQQSNS